MNEVATKPRLLVRRGQTAARNEAEAVADLKRQIDQPDASVVMFFASSHYKQDLLAPAMRSAFTCPIVGCTTAGEFGPRGYADKTLVGFSLASDELVISSHLITPLKKFDIAQIQEIGGSVTDRLSALRRQDYRTKAFGIFLIDGLSQMEEQIVSQVYTHLGELPLAGGSAGDDLCFRKTCVYHNGQFQTGAATITVFYTSLPFEVFKNQHFVPTDQKLVITGAVPQKRIVTEINGKPAAAEYARLVGLRVEQVEPRTLSQYPAMLRIGREHYTRSIQKINKDGSLTFYCAIDEGLVLSLTRSGDMAADLDRCLSDIQSRLGEASITIGFECAGRRVEVLERGLVEPANEVIQRHNLIGFHTYGEQFNSIHMNQTITGVAIGGQ